MLIGIYMLVFLGLLKKENMQIEGFFFYLFSGLFSGPVIHYTVAKIAGPVFFGRGFCGWACWTAMVLDYLPYKHNSSGRVSTIWESLRHIHFAFSLLLALALLVFFQYRSFLNDQTALVWLIAGNSLYFVSAILLTFTLKDNRAFCKYLCPITTILKATSRFAFLKIEGDQDKCTQCGACSKACPMDIDIMAYVKKGERVLSTECIFCLTCTTICPEGLLDNTFKRDIGGKDYLQRR